MKNFIPILEKTQLFSGVNPQDIESLLTCLGAKLRLFDKGAYVLRQGDLVGDIMVLVSGNLHIQQDDYWGNRSILGHISVGDMFGESYASPGRSAALNDVVAIENSTVMFLNVNRMLTICSSACRFHTLIIQNLFLAISEKNRRLVQKLGHMAKRSTREKLLSYLSEESKRQKSAAFTIPFNRQELADFLSVDRSAMSNELCKLRNEGLLSFNRSHFVLQEKPEHAFDV